MVTDRKKHYNAILIFQQMYSYVPFSISHSMILPLSLWGSVSRNFNCNKSHFKETKTKKQPGRSCTDFNINDKFKMIHQVKCNLFLMHPLLP